MSQIVLSAGGLIYSFRQVGPQIHDITGLPLDGDGWTDLLAMYNTAGKYTDSRIVYVSSSDGDNGTAVTYTRDSVEVGANPWDPAGVVMPHATFTSAKSQMRNGFPDIMLFKGGDTFYGGPGHWKTNGRAADERQIVSSYGDRSQRPLFLDANPVTIVGGSGAPSVGRYIIFEGFAAYHRFKDPDHVDYDAGQIGALSLAQIIHVANDILFENLHLRFIGLNIQGVGGRNTDIAVRRCIVENHYATGSHSQGSYCNYTDGLLFEECVYDHNGWNATTSGKTVFNHNFYIDDFNTDVTFRGNISARASSHGVQQRPGGVMHDNAFFDNAINALIGGGTDPTPGGVIADVKRNTIYGASNIGGNNPRGTGFSIANILNGEISANIIAYNTSGTSNNNYGISIDGDIPMVSVGVNDLLVANNYIYDWQGWEGAMSVIGLASVNGLEDNSVHNIQITNNTVVELGNYRVWHSWLESLPQIVFSGNQWHSERTAAQWFGLSNGSQYSLAGFNTLTGSSDTQWVNTPPVAPSVDSYMTAIDMTGGKVDFIAAAKQFTRAYRDRRLSAKNLGEWVRQHVGIG